jgi:parallel beta-helix repeat protein
MIADTTYSTLSNVSSNSGIYGVYLFQSSYDVITDCTIHNNRFGFYLYYYSSYNVITNCSAYDNQYGFYLRYSSYNVITGCTIFNNNYGVYIYTDSKSNAIYHNDFINNTYNAKDPYSNIWDNGYPSGGNYWSDYTGVDNYSGPDQDIPGSDGIGDTPYCIPGWGILGGSNQDQYPLMNPIGTDVIPPVTTATLEGNHSGDVYISDVKVTLTATDFGSGVNYTLYKLNSNAWITYTAPIIVSANGTHVVSFYSVDIAGNRETEKSCTFTIQQEVPSVNITIKGGLGISATITNNGAIDLTNVDWMISLDGGLIFFGKTKSGIITTLPAGESVTVRDFVIGFGKTMVTVTVTCVDSSDTAKQEAFVFLFFIR